MKIWVKVAYSCLTLSKKPPPPFRNSGYSLDLVYEWETTKVQVIVKSFIYLFLNYRSFLFFKRVCILNNFLIISYELLMQALYSILILELFEFQPNCNKVFISSFFHFIFEALDKLLKLWYCRLKILNGWDLSNKYPKLLHLQRWKPKKGPHQNILYILQSVLDEDHKKGFYQTFVGIFVKFNKTGKLWAFPSKKVGRSSSLLTPLLSVVDL